MKRIKTGDKVRIISGKNKTKEGVVLSVDNKNQRVVIEGLNMIKLHKKEGANQEKGGIIEKEGSIHISKVALVVPKAARGISKIKYTTNKDGKKVRVAKATNSEVSTKK